MHNGGDGTDSSLEFAWLEERREHECTQSEPLTPLIKGFTRPEGRLGMLNEKEVERRLAKRIPGAPFKVLLTHQEWSAPGLTHLGFISFPSAKWKESEGGHWGEAHEMAVHRNKILCAFTFLGKVVTEIPNDFENIYTEKSHSLLIHPITPMVSKCDQFYKFPLYPSIVSL